MLFIVRMVGGAPWFPGLWWQHLLLGPRPQRTISHCWCCSMCVCMCVCVCVQGTGSRYEVKQAWPCRVWFVQNRVWYSQPLAPPGSTHILLLYPDCVRCPHFLSRRKQRIILTLVVTHSLDAHQDPLPTAVARSRCVTSDGVISCPIPDRPPFHMALLLGVQFVGS